MKRAIVIICLVLVACVGTAAASTGVAGKKAAWTESKAERYVLSRATVRLAGEDRAALEEELNQAVELYWTLALDATLANDNDAANIYVDLAHRYGRALVRVRGGLWIDAADCSGRGPAATGSRFTSFHCRVTSESLEIPSAQLTDDGKTPVEGKPRSLGPIEAVLNVRVTGTSSFSYKPL